ncbi:Hypothetical predicted protein [Cloeon dipterum]|uniref:BTB domain-containing protein n=1 Tax=Cloeon dipterum TaxID=197152 RepID=A0A8S1BYH1_9INSE|nr:Hypothetical predicted protein [Cloeon dipterum]
MEYWFEDNFANSEEDAGTVVEVEFEYRHAKPNATIFVRLIDDGPLVAVFKVHREALTSNSPGLAAALSQGQFVELQALCRPDVDAMIAALSLVHTIEFPPVDSLLKSVIFRYGLLWQAECLCQEVQKDLSCDTALDAFLLYDLLEQTGKKDSYPQLSQRLLQQVAEDPISVFESDAWRVSHVQSLEAVLSIDKFPADLTELHLLDAALSWGWHVFHASGARIRAPQFFHRLLTKVRFVSVEPNQFSVVESKLKGIFDEDHLRSIRKGVLAGCPCSFPLSYSRKSRFFGNSARMEPCDCCPPWPA